MVRIEIDSPERDVQMALSYAIVLIKDEIRLVEPRSNGPESMHYLSGLKSAAEVLDKMSGCAHPQPELAGYSLTPNGDDALDRELRRRDQIAKGGA